MTATQFGGGPAREHGLLSPAEAAAATSPNIVVVLTDDQRRRTMNETLTPRIWTHLREKGTWFSQAMVPTALCCPSRSSILTGLFAHHSSVYGNKSPSGAWPVFHDQGLEKRTIAVTLQAEGYRTGLIGKYMNEFGWRAPDGYKPPGWDRFVSFERVMGAFFDYTLTDGTHHGTAAADYSTDVLRGYATRFIRNTRAGRPLFLFFTPFAPHRPFTPAPRHAGSLSGELSSYRPPSVTEDLSDKPAYVRKRNPVAQSDIDVVRRRQLESMMAVDDAVGHIVDALVDTGRMGNTVFVFLSDHGLMWGDHHIGALKNAPYRFATEIPMIVRWDGHTPPNTTSRRLALNLDLPATLAAAASTSMRTDGLDLFGDKRRRGFPLEAIRTRAGEYPSDRSAYCGYRTRKWMYARYATGEEELYSYVDDPYETQNLAGRAAHRDSLTFMRNRAIDTCKPTPPGYAW